MTEHEIEMEGIKNRLQAIELRLGHLESILEISQEEKSSGYEKMSQAGIPAATPGELIEEEKELESRIGRYGLASMGNIVLFLGIAFLAQYLMNKNQHVISAILGYSAALTVFLLAKYLKKSNGPLAFMFKINGQIILFFITIRLHFFSAAPLIQQEYLAEILLFLIIGYQVYWAIRNQSQSLSVISVIFAITAALVTDSTHFMLPIVAITAAVSVYYYYRFRWQPLVFITICLSYFAFFLWLFGNPFLDHKMAMISDHQNGIIYLFILGACYSSILFFRQKESASDDFFIGVTFTNGIIFTLLLALTVFKFFAGDYVALFLIITISCLLFSILLHSRSDWNFASAFYSLYGFMAMSIALFGLFGYPGIYILLPFQSLLVVSMALWFKNRLIVIMNSILFLFILAGYLLTSKSIDSVNFSFALIALISARVVNWQSSRLKIKTHIIRNLYLIEGFVMMLVALYHSIPDRFITLSWVMAALIYFLLSILLKNVKYRYMALGTVISAALYLFLVDLAKIELIYRVMALMFLAVISIGISMYYSNHTRKEQS
ncbi:MAG: hypothetical protein A2X05_15840 [Bacteroidetes bacterium GWE2_41_25]|nr:MAG: hypothetical protein A2X03_13475 [Bacteroidetes bacterium GWA2_40_15]OFX96832.1 MAG: hypothetical protein A2X05_15840 [Bacteroidetes bacterium GWE2_41_25]OFY00040.1 MAG: hypothetical protein A2X06_09320 [Bacteroidetes bacterium GWC2_40_22]OFY57292.1 MAG: hypothetical protein A2X04_17610 [Bacteroidetes bacterium GWF2_41_9]HBH83917.1 hypothetical protein [Bacteroidales bacterium]